MAAQQRLLSRLPLDRRGTDRAWGKRSRGLPSCQAALKCPFSSTTPAHPVHSQVAGGARDAAHEPVEPRPQRVGGALRPRVSQAAIRPSILHLQQRPGSPLQSDPTRARTADLPRTPHAGPPGPARMQPGHQRHTLPSAPLPLFRLPELQATADRCFSGTPASSTIPAGLTSAPALPAGCYDAPALLRCSLPAGQGAECQSLHHTRERVNTAGKRPAGLGAGRGQPEGMKSGGVGVRQGPRGVLGIARCGGSSKQGDWGGAH